MTPHDLSSVDERTLRYILDSRPAFDGLQHSLRQLAGFSLLIMTDGRRQPLLDAPAAQARQELAAQRDAIRALAVPATARHHHAHLDAAAEATARSLAALMACLRPADGDGDRAALVRCLRTATDHLRAAARALPGFETVDFGQACCATHAAMAEPGLC